MTSSEEKIHFQIIDMIRGIAALSVALLHIREINWVGMKRYSDMHSFGMSIDTLLAYISFPIVWGSIGVPIFFVISGYVIHRGSANKVNCLKSATTFWTRRFVRIYPTFIAAIFFTLVCDSFSSSYGAHGKLGDLSLHNAILNLLAIVGISGTPYGSNGALWSLAIEIQFYAVYPLASVTWKRIGARNMLALTAIISAASYLAFAKSEVKIFTTYYFSWWLGAYVADQQGVRKSNGKDLLLGSSLIGLGCLIFFSKNSILTHMVWSIGFALILFYVLNLEKRSTAAPDNLLKKYASRALVRCGTFSYSLYAIHLPIAVAFNIYFLKSTKQASIAWVIPCMALSMLGAHLIYVLTERPSIRLLKMMQVNK
jgi:peptidoglycan/LPS O-acetylase OafA/YrhL